MSTQPRQLFRTACIVCCLLIALVWAGSGYYEIEFAHRGPTSTTLFIYHGQCTVRRTPGPASLIAPEAGFDFRLARQPSGVRPKWLELDNNLGFALQLPENGNSTLAIPLWLPILMVLCLMSITRKRAVEGEVREKKRAKQRVVGAT